MKFLRRSARHACDQPPSPANRRRTNAIAFGLVLALGFTSFAAASAATGKPKHVATCATLSPGAAGPAVVTVQQLVKTAPDGDFGPMTQAALKKWQRHHHVRPTGVVDAATWAAMPAATALAACSQPVHGTGVAFTCAHLRAGASGPAVSVLQQAVKTDVDGAFGPATAAAVAAAQRTAKLKPSGIAGTATWAALGLTGTPACVAAPALTSAPTGGGTTTGATGSGSATSGPATTPGSTPPTATPTPAAGSGAGSGQTGAGKPKLTKQQRELRRARRAIAKQVQDLAAELLDTPAAQPDPITAAALAFATKQKGKPYRYGAAGPSSYDCSGLVMAAYLHAGLTLPRVAADQYAAGGQQIPLARARPGDLLFYASDLTDPSTIHHVVIYVGNGQVLDAPYTGAYVGTRPLWTNELLPVAVRPTGELNLPLRPDDSGWTVGQLQQALNRHGAGLSVDGGYGPQTLTAVNAWKAKHGLKPNGVVNRATWLTLG